MVERNASPVDLRSATPSGKVPVIASPPMQNESTSYEPARIQENQSTPKASVEQNPSPLQRRLSNSQNRKQGVLHRQSTLEASSAALLSALSVLAIAY